MQKWNCEYCGEEMLGAVNRCWRCGRPVFPPSPPPPVETARAVLAASDGAGATTAVLVADVAPAVAESLCVAALTVEEVALALAKEPPRRGSPFAVEATLSERKTHETYYGEGPYRRDAAPRSKFLPPPRSAAYPQHPLAFGGIVAGLLLGIASAVLAPISIFAVILAIMGMACSIVGLYGRPRFLAIIGIGLCCIALLICAYHAAFLIYYIFYSPPVAAPNQGLTF